MSTNGITNNSDRNNEKLIICRDPELLISQNSTISNETPPKDNTLSSRFELKYRIREAKARAIASYIKTHMPLDKYSALKPDLQYYISSLYLDSDRLDLCRETIEKKTNRFKLRIRCYDDNPQSPCFVEIKRRLNSVIHKGRVRTNKADINKIINGYRIPLVGASEKDKSVMNQFQYYVRSLHARPIVMVRYLREAYEDTSNNRVRITFDRKLAYRSTNKPELHVLGNGWREVPMDFVVLEIKFTDKYPLWLNDMIKIFDLKQTSMSKYVSTVKQSCALGFCAPACRSNINNYIV